MIKVLIYMAPLVLIYILLFIIVTRNEASHITKGDGSYNDTRCTTAGDNRRNRYTKERAALRERPPNASFFSRVDGVEKTSEGSYEEQYLGVVETIRWKKQLLKEPHKRIKSL